MGGSAALALKARGLARTVVGVSRRESTLKEAMQAGAVDEATLDLQAGTAGADMVLVATPVRSIVPVVSRVLPSLGQGAVVTDVGSTKSEVVSAVQQLPSGERFVGSHPMAGSEQTGVANADAALYEGATVIVTPTPANRPSDVEIICSLWESLGSRVVRLDARVHDALVAGVSHLPHVLAALMVAQLKDVPLSQVASVAGDGFFDTTRIASSDSRIWVDICLTNKDEILRFLDSFDKDLNTFRKHLEDRNEEALSDLFERSKETRGQLVSLREDQRRNRG